eukprot:snap_masked-scaffold_50-processed-gene-1.26-mRNA-1 protein AED:1.00 eAED:1.00 QI:0/0/0/0/1/1/2/0/76
MPELIHVSTIVYTLASTRKFLSLSMWNMILKHRVCIFEHHFIMLLTTNQRLVIFWISYTFMKLARLHTSGAIEYSS